MINNTWWEGAMRLLVRDFRTLELLDPGIFFMSFAMLPSPWQTVFSD